MSPIEKGPTVVTMQFDWANHRHILEMTTCRGSDHYSGDREGEVCSLCQEAANQSGIPHKEHFKHPRDCKCFQCVFCKCSKVNERDK